VITIEKRWMQRANGMTLAEIELELEKLPVSPKSDDDLIGRAVLARRRLELVDASKPNLQAPPPDPAGMVEVIVPDGGGTCVQSRTMPRKFYYATVKDGRATIAMPWAEFNAIAFATAGTAGPSGGQWLECNPHLKSRFPQNPPAPLPESPR
jgi:hypothetical protein